MRQNVDICAVFPDNMENFGEIVPVPKLSLAFPISPWYGRVGLTRSGGPLRSARQIPAEENPEDCQAQREKFLINQLVGDFAN